MVIELQVSRGLSYLTEQPSGRYYCYLPFMDGDWDLERLSPLPEVNTACVRPVTATCRRVCDRHTRHWNPALPCVTPPKVSLFVAVGF